MAQNVNHWRWWGNSVPSAETTTKRKIENMKPKLSTSSPTIANENVGGSTGTEMHECVDCGWFGLHEYKSKRKDESWTTDVCPDCGAESFYISQTVGLPCEICEEIVLVQQRLVKEDLNPVVCGKCHSTYEPEYLQSLR